MKKLPPYKQGAVMAVKRLKKGIGCMTVAAKRREAKAAAKYGPVSPQTEKALADRLEMEAAYKLIAVWAKHRLLELEGDT